MSSYVRPAIVEQTYLDADGAVIQYGNRWPKEGPPADSYSVDTHPERFAPLHQIADALIDHLRRNYDVEIIDDLSCVQDVRYRHSAVRAVRLTPASADAAPLTFVFTSYPGVIMHAGLLHDFVYPQCGCDACDETWDSVADGFERTVQAVVSGGYREEVRDREGGPWIWYQLRAADGSGSTSGGSEAVPAGDADLRTASARLEALPGGWVAWPARR